VGGEKITSTPSVVPNAGLGVSLPIYAGAINQIKFNSSGRMSIPFFSLNHSDADSSEEKSMGDGESSLVIA